MKGAEDTGEGKCPADFASPRLGIRAYPLGIRARDTFRLTQE